MQTTECLLINSPVAMASRARVDIAATTLSTDGPAILEDARVGAGCLVEENLLRHGHAIGIGQVRTLFASR